MFDRSQDRTNPPAAAKGDKSAMRPFAKLLLTPVLSPNSSSTYTKTIFASHSFFALFSCNEARDTQNILVI